MAKCPFCGKEMGKYLLTEWTLQQMFSMLVLFGKNTSIFTPLALGEAAKTLEKGCQCPRCGKRLGLRSFGEFKAFLEDELAVILKEKAKVKRNFALYDDEVYEVVREERSDDGTEILIAKRITDELKASIIAASF